MSTAAAVVARVKSINEYAILIVPSEILWSNPGDVDVDNVVKVFQFVTVGAIGVRDELTIARINAPTNIATITTMMIRSLYFMCVFDITVSLYKTSQRRISHILIGLATRICLSAIRRTFSHKSGVPFVPDHVHMVYGSINWTDDVRESGVSFRPIRSGSSPIAFIMLLTIFSASIYE